MSLTNLLNVTDVVGIKAPYITLYSTYICIIYMVYMFVTEMILTYHTVFACPRNMAMAKNNNHNNHNGGPPCRSGQGKGHLPTYIPIFMYVHMYSLCICIEYTGVGNVPYVSYVPYVPYVPFEI